MGVTATNSEQLIEAVKAFNFGYNYNAIAWFNTRKYISFEPLLSDMKDAEVLFGSLARIFKECNIFWLIIGSQTKPYKPPKIEWVREIVEACDKAMLPVFIKNNLSPYTRNIALYPKMKIGDEGWDVIRQEMPCQ